jgi:predicted nucleotidyltransferase
MTVEEAEQAVILKVLVGSHIHGLNVETSDEDVEAIVIEPIEEAMGLGNPFEELIKLNPDVKYVSLRKWCRLACKGNPNFLLPLFAPEDKILKVDARGSQLRDLRDAFISKQAIKSHLGYMQGQRNRMLNDSNGGRGKPRHEKDGRHLPEGAEYDTKFAMHLIRLAMQGCELAESGKINLPMLVNDRQACLDIRNGKWSLEAVLRMATDLEERMKRAFDDSKLPELPDYAIIETKMITFYQRAWSAARSIMDAQEDEAIRNAVCGGGFFQSRPLS